MKVYIGYVFAATLSLISFIGCAQQHTALLEKKDPAICREVNSGKMWSIQKAGPFSTLKDANRFALELHLGGFDDWRLPTRHELFQLFHTFYRKQNSNCSMNQSGEYWTVEKDGSGSLGHWETYILCDVEFTYIKAVSRQGYARVVRP